MSISRVLVIAEAGVNHNGSVETALQLVDVAAAAGADIVKFQTFQASKVISVHAPKARYQVETTGSAQSQLEMVQKLELDERAHARLVARCAEKKIEFMSTPFDLESVTLLERLGVRRLKIPSGEITHPHLLKRAAATQLPIILSTGMSTLGDIEAALDVLDKAYSESGGGESGREKLHSRVTLLHCTTEYPAPLDEINLRAMGTMRQAFNLPIGYSDHTEGISVSIAAVALGATVIEKHFTLDRSQPGPDHRASLEPTELQALVDGIRAVERALGSPRKAPSTSERKNMAVARKSLVAARAIRCGEKFTADNLAVKRPGSGISPMRYEEYLGRNSERDYEPDEPI